MAIAKNSSPSRIISWAQLRTMVPYTRQHILRLENAGKFPRRVRVGDNRIGWLLAEIEDWIAVRASARDDRQPTTGG